MARYQQDYFLPPSREQSFQAIHQYLTSQGFEYREFEGEQVFKHGKGWFAAPTIFKISFYGDRIRVESWLKYALLPGVYVGELGMEGFVGCLAKGKMKRAAVSIDGLLGGPAARMGRVHPHLLKQAPQPQYQPQPQVQSVPNSNMRCLHCGAAIQPGTKFCTNCGKTIG